MPVSRFRQQVAGPVPYWRSECGRASVYVGDCREVLARLEPEQFHAVVTDPPYGLEFMGKEWDAPWRNEGKIETCDGGMHPSHPFRDGTQRVCYGNYRPKGAVIVNPATERGGFQDGSGGNAYSRSRIEYGRDSNFYQQWFHSCANAILHATKSGAYLLSFGGTRMWHRMACAIEDAGWDIRDTIMWVYGSGFPKSHNISKAIDKIYGAEREVTGHRTSGLSQGQFSAREIGVGGHGYKAEYNETKPNVAAAVQWDGWGTALKPAVEPIIVAHKPLIGSVAQNTLKHGCGGLNIDGCRVGTDPMPIAVSNGTVASQNTSMAAPNTERIQSGTKNGRWPANLIHDGSDEVVELFPHSRAGTEAQPHGSGGIWSGKSNMPCGPQYADNGSAARFFYTAKADNSDRPHGKGAIVHPTVKPLDLMRYLVRLVCAPGGTVLDPFMGSGSTGVAALGEGMRFVGMEQSQEYADIAVGRLKLALETARPLVELRTYRASAVSIQQLTAPPVSKLRGVI